MRYDIHNHTRHSTCSNMKPGTLLKLAKKRGMDGMAVTDHNTIKGALDVKKLNRDKDFEVIVGCEVDTNYGDVLAYYLNKEIKSREFGSVVDEVKRQGGLIVIAHPFRKSLNPKHTFAVPLKEVKNKIDGVECLNARMLPGSNEKAQKAARELDLAGTGGSDAHFSFEVGRSCTIFDGNLAKALKQKKTRYEGTTLYGPFGGFLSFLRNRLGIYKLTQKWQA